LPARLSRTHWPSTRTPAAIWGAVACAIEMQHAMDEVNGLNRESGLAEVVAGIAVNTGEVIVGNIGSERRMKYGVVGHHVNFTARIGNYAQGGEILVSDRTREICGDIIELGGDMRVQPKGFDYEVQLHFVQGIGGQYGLKLARS